MSKHTATFYVQAKPKLRRLPDHEAKPFRVEELRVVKMSQTMPRSPEPGAVVLKLNLTLPDDVFMPLAPEVNIEVPAEHIEVVPLVDVEPMPVPVEAKCGPCGGDGSELCDDHADAEAATWD